MKRVKKIDHMAYCNYDLDELANMADRDTRRKSKELEEIRKPTGSWISRLLTVFQRQK